MFQHIVWFFVRSPSGADDDDDYDVVELTQQHQHQHGGGCNSSDFQTALPAARCSSAARTHPQESMQW